MLYRWNTLRAKHHFCWKCGISSFNRKRAAPDHYGVDIHRIEGFPRAVPARATSGADMPVATSDARAEWPGPRDVREPN